MEKAITFYSQAGAHAPVGQVKNVTLIIAITAAMAFGVIAVTLLVDLLPIPAMHPSNAGFVQALKTGFSN